MSNHHQRIHPVPDPEAPPPRSPPTAPLIPPNSLKSDSQHTHDHYPPPPPRTLPQSFSPPPRKRSRRSCCCRLCCYTFTTLLLLIIAVAATVGILFLIFRPKIPKYSIDTLRVTQFSPASNGSLTASFAVNVTAYNPNKHIGIYYLGGSHLSAWYQNQLLCEGGLPKFYQGHHNTTFVNVPLSGTVNDAQQFSTRIQQQVKDTGNIPLVLTGKVPIKVKLGKLKLMKMKFKVHCELSVDNLTSNNDVRISKSNCKIRLKRIF